ncbi:MAG: PhaM family polyhydroxyalkanoate granule multifunctional regulatory protein, partial [Quisquiliibacterium sp.]
DKQASGTGPMSGMLDAMDFLRQAWGNFNLPSNLAPTMDPAEIDRRIADLKVVEQWLSANLGMLRGAIQGMEVQRETISALRSLGEAMTPPTASSEATPLANELARTSVAAINPNAWWQLLQSQFNQLAQASLSAGAAGSSPGKPQTSGVAGSGKTRKPRRAGPAGASNKGDAQ